MNAWTADIADVERVDAVVADSEREAAGVAVAAAVPVVVLVRDVDAVVTRPPADDAPEDSEWGSDA